MPILVDTDVIIDYLRGNPNAIKFIENSGEQLFISTITVAELYAGVREGKEKTILDTFLSAFEIIPVDKNIATEGGLIRRDYARKNGIGIADALIAATAKSLNVNLVTLNTRHFSILENVILPYEKS